MNKFRMMSVLVILALTFNVGPAYAAYTLTDLGTLGGEFSEAPLQRFRVPLLRRDGSWFATTPVFVVGHENQRIITGGESAIIKSRVVKRDGLRDEKPGGMKPGIQRSHKGLQV